MKKLTYILFSLAFLNANSFYVFGNNSISIFEKQVSQNKYAFDAINDIYSLKTNLNSFEPVNELWYNLSMPTNDFLKNLCLAFGKSFDKNLLGQNLGYIKREDLCMILGNILNLQANNNDIYTEISDFEDISFFAKNGLNYVLSQNILSLDEENRFNPKQNITYIEGYKIINDLYNKHYQIDDNTFYNALTKSVKMLSFENNLDDKVELVYYNLYDKAYENALYGEDEFSSHACGPTSMAMIVSSYTGNIRDPLYMAKWCFDNGFYVKGCGSSHNMIVECARAFGLDGQALGRDKEKIIDALVNGKMVVALMGKGTFTEGGHYIILRGITDDGKILVSDSKSYEKSIQQYDINLILNEAKNAGFGGPFWSIGYLS